VTSTIVNRPPRMHPPPIEDDVITLLDPPQPQDTQSGAQGVFQVLFPVLGTAGSMIFILANPRPVAVAAGLVFMMASVGVGLGMFLVQRGLPRRRLREDRARYLEYLEQVREQLRGARRNQMAAEAFRHPEPERLLDLASDTSRLWERRVYDTDFLSFARGYRRRPAAFAGEAPGRTDADGPRRPGVRLGGEADTRRPEDSH
jgi:S-DNA-T family DNA segregation ATPase FtsK/SpoIIIE